MVEKYINPFTDFGFKKLFGEEANKDLLIDFLNQLLHEQEKITSLSYLKNEHLGASQEDRKAIFDLYCENSTGEKFIVELQKAKQRFFKDRSIYYSTFPIQEQSKQGDWNYELKAVYTIAVMDFIFDENKLSQSKFRHDIQLLDTETYEVFYDKLRFIYLEMPKFNKAESELETHYDKWLYIIKNLYKFQDRPQALQERVFQRLFEVAEIAKFNPKERQAYQDSLKYYRDLKNVFDTIYEEAFEQGLEKGIEQGIEQGIEKGIEQGIEKGIEQGIEQGIEKGQAAGRLQEKIDIAKKALTNGIAISVIVLMTGLSEEEIRKL